ncbi:hypothetical protein HETIRDRAFT_454442 [Heterobasidion irregulare TC 32-1]|uniref:Uncharacterized protein n=1 Tax=Heterobasidion irregulare (strain TC 32-1) TaxID=747525 RepID=W4JTZ6_HETIT|nr:uncharacterized protein HETIRDRAFT_454442 [Heterobasidion irregulare TC 32-1]ETW77028.1 hypothetical protein HETIRDRAFT_454442 [Heterobasidion irregulare TC 32-1]
MSLTIQIRWGYDASTAYGCIDKIEMFEEERGEASHLQVIQSAENRHACKDLPSAAMYDALCFSRVCTIYHNFTPGRQFPNEGCFGREKNRPSP